MNGYIPRIGTYFTGGGIGLASLYYNGKIKPVFGVEFDAAISKAYELNYGGSGLIVDKVQNVNPKELPDAEIAQVSPECTQFSSGNVYGEEGAEEISQAQACIDLLRAKQPPYYIVENVRKYAESLSFRMIKGALDRENYRSKYRVVKAADYGIPQTRERLLLIASREDMPEYTWPMPTHHRGPEIVSLFGEVTKPWVGWYETVKDIAHTFEPDNFANWQLKYLPELNKTFVMDGQENNHKSSATIRYGEEPYHTVTATINKRIQRAYIASGEDGRSGRVVRISPRALARMQSIPDAYYLPEGLTSIIGNGVPSRLLEIFVEPMIDALALRNGITQVA